MRSTLLALLVCASACTFAQEAMRPGGTYSKTVKGLEGDVQLVANGITDLSGHPVLFMMEGNGYRAVRLGADMKPSEDLSLAQQTFDGAKWDAVSSIVADDKLHILFVSNTKKSADYGIGRLNTEGAFAIQDFHRVATFEYPNEFDPSTTTCRKTLPDLILFDSGASYDQSERIVASPDGQHYLVNHYTTLQKGNKKFWFTCLDKSFQKEWSGVAELPFEDLNSDIHQIVLDNSGRIILLTYNFPCGDQGRAGDKLCHETHLTVIKDQGAHVKDLLLEKDFVSSARVMAKDNGKLLIAVRYGALTGQPGFVVSLDTMMAKLKPTPLMDQRVPAIRKMKLTTFGVPDDGSGKKPSGTRAAKVPDEIIDLIPAWNGGSLLIEGFRDQDLQVQLGDATAIRTLHGAVRATYFDATDSIRWQQTVDRAFMTTAGEAYGSAAFKLLPEGLLLAYNDTPGGLTEINNSYADASGKKKEKSPVEKSQLKLAMIPSSGGAPKEKVVGKPEGDFTICPMTMVRSSTGDKLWIKAYDRGTQHQFVEVDTGVLEK